MADAGHLRPRVHAFDANRPQLLTYPDSLGRHPRGRDGLLAGRSTGSSAASTSCPPFPSTGDRGFAPSPTTQIDPAIRVAGRTSRISDAATRSLLDVMVNHISRHSPEFQAFARDGRRSPTADLFITPDKVWPDGEPPPDDLARLFLRRSPRPVLDVHDGRRRCRDGLDHVREGEVSEQIDLDLATPAAATSSSGGWRVCAAHGVSMVRLDAVGYVVKKAGTSVLHGRARDLRRSSTGRRRSPTRSAWPCCPRSTTCQATHEQLDGARPLDVRLRAARARPPRARDRRDAAARRAPRRSPDRQVTTLDCHDGIPVRPDLEGILSPDEMRALADARASSAAATSTASCRRSHATRRRRRPPAQLHLLLGARGDDEDRYLAARAIQLFARGIPQVYYVGLLAGANDQRRSAATGEGRVDQPARLHDGRGQRRRSARPVVRRLARSHPAAEHAPGLRRRARGRDIGPDAAR